MNVTKFTLFSGLLNQQHKQEYFKLKMEISKVYSIILLSCLVGFDIALGQTEEQLQLIEGLVERFITENGVIGYGLSVIQNGEILLSKGYGKANIAEDVDIQNNTLFAVGSISKTFTCLLAVKVLSEKFPDLGEAVLDTPISQLQIAPSLNFTLSDRYRTEAASFRDLLTHRTCLANDDMIVLFQAGTYDEISYRKRYDLSACSFRTAFSYNNGLIQLAGNLLGKIAGSSYPELMSDLFAQLGMVSSRILDAEGSHEELPNMSRAYTRIGNELVQYDSTHLRKASAIGGGGAVLSSPTDMAHFLKFMFNGGLVDGIQVVPAEVLNWMHTVSLAFPFDAASGTGPYGYGVGLILAMLEGAPWIKHNGFFAPYESAFNMFPLENGTYIGLFGSANGPGGTADNPELLSQDLMHVLIKEILEDKISNNEQLNQARKRLSSNKAMSSSIDIESHPLSPKNVQKSLKPIERKGKVANRQLEPEELVGAYGDRRNGDLTITYIEANQTLRLNYGKWGIGNLIQRSDPDQINVYDVEWTTTVYYDFYAFGSVLPFPEYAVDFGVVDVVELIMYEIPELGLRFSFKFNRDETLDTLPEIPYSPESCGPEV